jgi:uncharacterized membrane protein
MEISSSIPAQSNKTFRKPTIGKGIIAIIGSIISLSALTRLASEGELSAITVKSFFAVAGGATAVSQFVPSSPLFKISEFFKPGKGGSSGGGCGGGCGSFGHGGDGGGSCGSCGSG